MSPLLPYFDSLSLVSPSIHSTLLLLFVMLADAYGNGRLEAHGSILTRYRLFIKTTSCRRLWYWQVSLSSSLIDSTISWLTHGLLLDPVSSITFLKTSVCVFAACCVVLVQCSPWTHFSVKKDSVNTIGMEFGTRIVHIADKSIKLQIWDTAGQV